MAAPLEHGLRRPAIVRLTRNVERAWPAFESKGFTAGSMRGLARLELKPRVSHVAAQLATFLPRDYGKALAIVVRASETRDRGDEGDPLRGFAAWRLFDFIEHHGTGDFTRSMAALRSMTRLLSAEFVIRSFIAHYPERAFAVLRRWTKDDSEQVRRLASEGARPQLPWATQVPALIDDPSPVLAVLDRLKDDPALYVRRSVANNLNDIAKDHPDRVLDVCERGSTVHPKSVAGSFDMQLAPSSSRATPACGRYWDSPSAQGWQYPGSQCHRDACALATMFLVRAISPARRASASVW